MPEALPPELAALFAAKDPTARDSAWAGFVALHSRLLLHAARSLGRDYDGAMDRYTYALDQLRDRDFQRLRAYRPDGRTKFTTWLLVVFRRLCLDHYRHRYGRSPTGESQEGDRMLRRQLADGVLGPVDPELVAAPAGRFPDAELTSRELGNLLASALSALPAADRFLLKLRFEDGLSASQIARIVALPTPFHVYRRLNAVLASLRDVLRAGGIEGPDG
jgi:RNA polymerase sigma factor (sigma-70 family)